jgi:predicted small metal-binding protein
MAYEFDCTNVVPGCDGTVTDETKDEVLQEAARHAKEAHGMTELPDDLAQSLLASIRPTD